MSRKKSSDLTSAVLPKSTSYVGLLASQPPGRESGADRSSTDRPRGSMDRPGGADAPRAGALSPETSRGGGGGGGGRAGAYSHAGAPAGSGGLSGSRGACGGAGNVPGGGSGDDQGLARLFTCLKLLKDSLRSTSAVGRPFAARLVQTVPKNTKLAHCTHCLIFTRSVP